MYMYTYWYTHMYIYMYLYPCIHIYTYGYFCIYMYSRLFMCDAIIYPGPMVGDEDWAYGDGYYLNDFGDIDDMADIGVIGMPYQVIATCVAVTYVTVFCVFLQCVAGQCGAMWWVTMATTEVCGCFTATHYNTLQHSTTRCNSDTFRSTSVSTTDEMYGCVACDVCGGVCGVVWCLGCKNRWIMICCNLTSSLSAASSRAAHATSKKFLGTQNRNLFTGSRKESRRLGEASHFAQLP